jgi:hypothetical protein
MQFGLSSVMTQRLNNDVHLSCVLILVRM